MPDSGQRATDAEFRRLRAKVNDVYRQAYREIAQKGKDYAQAHAKREAQLRQQVADGKMTQADFDAWMRGQVFQGRQWQLKRQQMADTLYKADQTAQAMVNDSRFDVFAKNANYTTRKIRDDTGINASFELYDANAVKRLMKEEPDLLPPRKVGKDKSYQWYNRQIQSAITQGIIQGEGIADIALRIGRRTGESSATAMLRNARTMFTGAQNAGRIEGLHQAQKLGIRVQKKWLATPDDRTRDTHAELDGEVVDVDEPFVTSEGNAIMYPGDPAAAPEEVWNCRCTLVYVYPEYEEEAERGDEEAEEDTPLEAEKIDHTGRTADCYSEEQRRAISDIVEKTTGPARDVWDKMVSDLDAPVQDTKENEAFFRPYDGRVHYNAAAVARGDSIHLPYQNHFHEYFHNIDYKLGTGYGYLSTQYTDPVTGKSFDKMLGDESLAAVKKYFEGNLEKIGLGGYTYTEAMKETWTAKMVMNGFARDVKSKYSLMDRANISDMFEKFFVTHHGSAYPFGAGHGSTYAKDKGARAREAFAEMADATFTNPGALSAIKDFFPESYRIWEDMLKEVTK